MLLLLIIEKAIKPTLNYFFRCYFINYLQLEQLENELAGDRDSLRNAESLSTDLMKEKALLEKTLETLRENSERQVHSQTHRNLSLNQMVLILNDHD